MQSHSQSMAMPFLSFFSFSEPSRELIDTRSSSMSQRIYFLVEGTVQGMQPTAQIIKYSVT